MGRKRIGGEIKVIATRAPIELYDYIEQRAAREFKTMSYVIYEILNAARLAEKNPKNKGMS